MNTSSREHQPSRRSILGPLAGILLTTAALMPSAGCGNNSAYVTPDRLANGLVIILPGIEGESELNHNIRRGLIRAGVHRALPIHPWGRPVPLAGVLLNQVDFLGNRLAGMQIANMIVQYQEAHPGRPVHIIGHSGGGGVAVFAAEALPEGKQVDGLILLSASISSAYDLTKALSHCRNGIVNFYNRQDTALLGIGTTVVGNVDGTHGPSAGLIGFDKPGPNAPRAKRIAYSKLYQVALTSSMTGGGDPHAVATRPEFVSRYVARWVISPTWPAGSAVVACRP